MAWWKDALSTVAGGAAAFIPGVGPLVAPLVGGGLRKLLGDDDDDGGAVRSMEGAMRGNLNRGMSDAFGFTGGAADSIGRGASQIGGGRDFGSLLTQTAMAPPPTVTSGGDGGGGGGFWGDMTGAQKVGLGLGAAGMGFDIYNKYKQGKKRDNWLEGSKAIRSRLMGSF